MLQISETRRHTYPEFITYVHKSASTAKFFFATSTDVHRCVDSAYYVQVDRSRYTCKDKKKEKKFPIYFLVAKDDPLLIWVVIFESLHSIPPRKCLKMEMFFNSHTSKSLQRLVAPTRELHDHENNSTEEEGASPAPSLMDLPMKTSCICNCYRTYQFHTRGCSSSSSCRSYLQQ